MKKLLIAYYSESGSTKEMAETMAQNINGKNIDVLPVSEVKHLNYDAVILGTPNWYGKPTPKVVRFIKKYENELAQLPLAFFFSCMDCYKTEQAENLNIQIYCDSHFKNQVKPSNQLTSWEKSHAVNTYFNNLNKISNRLNIQSVAFFKGRLNFKKLSFFNALVMRFICLINKKIKQGDYFKRQDLIEWSNELKEHLSL